MNADESRAEAEIAQTGDADEAWHRLLQVSSRVLRAIDHALELADRMMVSEFDVLITLDNAPGRSLRMTDLARATMLSSGGMTRLVGRLEQRGLVQREPDPSDARAFNATLTPAGRDALAHARLAHDAVIADELAARLTQREIRRLHELLGKLLAPSAG